MGLRPYQQKCLSNIQERRQAGIKRQLVSLFTGGGKTVIFANLPSMMPRDKQMMMLVHTTELVEQGAEKIAKWNPSLNIGVEMASRHVDGREDVVVASVQTLGKAGSPRLHKFNPDKFHWVVTDEAHRAIAPTYQRVNDYFMRGEDVCLTGFTATSQRGDGQAMAAVFDEIVYQYGMLEGIEDGWVVPIHGLQIRTGTDLSNISKADIGKEEVLSKAVNTPRRNETIVKAWIEYAWPRATVAFTVDINHARDLAAAFRNQGIRSEAVWGDDPDRRKKLELFRAGEIDVLTNAAMLIEGFDMWQVECVILGAPSKSQGRIIQKVGRGSRLEDGIGNLNEWREKGLLLENHKSNLLVLDCCDITGKHSLVSLPSLFGLPSNMDLQGASVVAAIKAIKEAQAKYPQADVSNLENLSDLDSYARKANLWSVRFAEDVSGFSELQWTKRGDGSYRILCPKGDFFKVEEDMVGKFSVEGSLKGKGYRQTKLASLSDAVSLVEKTITSDAPEHLILLGREQKWHKQPMSESQRNILKKFKIPDDVLVHMSRGQAAAKITQLFDKRS